MLRLSERNKPYVRTHGFGSTLPQSYLWANVRFPLDEFRSSICRTSTTCHELITQTSLRENKCNDHQSYSEQCICLYTFVWTCLYTFGFAHNPKSISFKLWSSSISKFSYKEKSRLSTRHTWPMVSLLRHIYSAIQSNRRLALPVWGPCERILGCAHKPSLTQFAWKTPSSPSPIGDPLR